jgi:hypothetical protein
MNCDQLGIARLAAGWAAVAVAVLLWQRAAGVGASLAAAGESARLAGCVLGELVGLILGSGGSSVQEVTDFARIVSFGDKAGWYRLRGGRMALRGSLLRLLPADIRRYIKIKQMSKGDGHPENVPVTGRSAYPKGPRRGGAAG